MSVAEGAKSAAQKAREAREAETRLDDIMRARFTAMFGDDESPPKKEANRKAGEAKGRREKASSRWTAPDSAEVRPDPLAAAAAASNAGKKAKGQKRRRDDDDDDDDDACEDVAMPAPTAKATTKATKKRDGAVEATASDITAGQARASDSRAVASSARPSQPAMAATAVPTVVFGGDRPMRAASQLHASAPGNAAGLGRAK
jgi:hypothetical protein